MKLYEQVLFTPASPPESVVLAPTEAAAVFDMPTPDPNNPDTEIANGGAEIAVAFSPLATADKNFFIVGSNASVLLRGGAASLATTVVIKGRSPVTISRGVATDQHVYANR